MILFMTFLIAAAPASAPEQAELQYGVCVHCHGAHGEGRPELGTPRIGDLDTDYIAVQLKAFRDGTRGAHGDDLDAKPMAAIAKGLKNDATVTLLAAYVEGLTPEHRSAGEKDEVGAALYQTCASCHGADATGNRELGAPNLLFQDSSYLARQLRHYRDKKRGGAGAPPLAVAMTAVVADLSDADVEHLVTHIASLRPDRPPLNNYPVSLTAAEGLAAFGDIFSVVTHPRCLNCHPDGDRPLQTDESIPHAFNITRMSPFKGVHCTTCHVPSPVGKGTPPIPPADPIWSLAPKQMVFQHRTPREICEQLKDPERNGGRGSIDSTDHISHDHLLQTSWHSGRQPPPISHAELVKRFETWGRAGSPCPP